MKAEHEQGLVRACLAAVVRRAGSIVISHTDIEREFEAPNSLAFAVDADAKCVRITVEGA